MRIALAEHLGYPLIGHAAGKQRLGHITKEGNSLLRFLLVMKWQVQLCPNSGNAYDSLGEAYALNGEQRLAIQNSKRSIELDPNNKNAAAREKLEGQR